MSVDGVKLILQVSEDGQVIPTQAQRIRTREFPWTQRFYKPKFIVYKYVWETIDEDCVYMSNGGSVDTFATEFSRMYDDPGKFA